MLLMIEICIRGGICQSIYWYVKAYNEYMKNYEKIKNHHNLSIGNQIICMDGQCYL